MICSKCGTQNLNESKFCIKCGSNLMDNFQNNFQSNNNVNLVNNQYQQMNNNSVNNQYQQMNNNSVNNQYQQMNNVPVNNQYQQVNNNFVNEQPSSYNEPIQVNQGINYQNQMPSNGYNQTTVNSSNESISFGSYFFIILAVILKPFTAFKEEMNKLNVFKNSAIVALIVSLFATVVTLLKNMYSAVRVSSYAWGSGTTKSWVWSNLKEINYIKIIGTNFLIFLGIIFAIAIVYYLASLIIKKQVNFSKLLGIAALSVVPFVICFLILSPLLSKLYAPFSMIINIIGLVYTIVLIYETMNTEITIEGNAKYYFNLICLSLLAISGYYLYVNVFATSVSNQISNILGQFGF